MNNMAEGFERSTDPDKARFLDIAKGSAGKMCSMYYAAEDVKYVTSTVVMRGREKTVKISGGIATLTFRFRQRTEKSRSVAYLRFVTIKLSELIMQRERQSMFGADYRALY